MTKATSNTEAYSLAPLTTVKAVKAEVTKAHRLFSSAERSTREARVHAAHATRYAVEQGLIGADGEWKTQDDYAAALGVSKGTVTGLKRLGVALAAGVVPGSETWNLLSSKAGTKEAGDILSGDDLTAEKIAAAVKKVWTPDGKKVTTGKADDKETRAAQPEGKAQVEYPRNHSGLLEMIETALARFDRDKITPKERERLEGIGDTVAEMIAHQYKNGQTAEKVADAS